MHSEDILVLHGDDLQKLDFTTLTDLRAVVEQFRASRQAVKFVAVPVWLLRLVLPKTVKNAHLSPDDKPNELRTLTVKPASATWQNRGGRASVHLAHPREDLAAEPLEEGSDNDTVDAVSGSGLQLEWLCVSFMFFFSCGFDENCNLTHFYVGWCYFSKGMFGLSSFDTWIEGENRRFFRWILWAYEGDSPLQKVRLSHISFLSQYREWIKHRPSWPDQ